MTKPKTKPAPAPGAFPDTAPADTAATPAVASVSPIAATNATAATNAPPDPPAPVPAPVVAVPDPEPPVPEAPVGYMMQPKIVGYTHINEREARVINRVKAQAKEARELTEDLERFGAAADDLALAIQHLKIGYSLLTRSIAKPSEW